MTPANPRQCSTSNMTWISVNDKLPPDYWNMIWIFDAKWGVMLGYYYSWFGWETKSGAEPSNVTHWQPLDRPNPPTEDDS